MPYLLPQAADNGIVDVSGDNSRTIKIDSEEWFQWLNEPTTLSFRFTSGFANRHSFTVRKEYGKSGNIKWQGYKRINKILKKTYLGKTTNLTLKRLIEAAYFLFEASENAVDEMVNTMYGSALNVKIPEGYFWHRTTKNAMALQLLDDFLDETGIKIESLRAAYLLKFKNWLLVKNGIDSQNQPDEFAAVLSPFCEIEPIDLK